MKNAKEVEGVLVERFGEELSFLAKREVIVSAGSIGSPQLLMLSGIGPRDELKKHNIKLVKNLPVGENLQARLSSGRGSGLRFSLSFLCF
jgi:choline dehydrogenase-like flavoprotein